MRENRPPDGFSQGSGLTDTDPARSLLERGANMVLTIELEQEEDGRWLGEVGALPGVMAYGVTRADAIARTQALALRVLAERLEHGEAVPELLNVSFLAA